MVVAEQVMVDDEVRVQRETSGLLGALAQLLAGVAATIVALKGHDLAMMIRALGTVSGSIFVYRGLGSLGRLRWGPGWDMALWCSAVWLVLVGGSSLLAPVLPLAEGLDSAATLREPVFARPDLFSDHPLGTDGLGLDLLSRVIYGARLSLTVSLTAVLVGVIVGGAIGIVAGYLGGITDRGVSLGVDAWLAFPPLILLLTLAQAVGRGSKGLMIGLALVAIPTNVRLARATTQSLARRGFIRSAEAIGTLRRQILMRELAPPVAISLLSYSVAVVASLIVAEASLSFLGLGVAPPTPSWGLMIAEGQNGRIEEVPHLVAVPGTVLLLTVVSLNLVGDRLRRRWDVGGG